MSIESIGNIIAKLRKEKGAKQEELAKYTHVSPQAVSKWEKGGVPDTELLPKIADFFKVSIDTLFGRNSTDYSEIENVLAKKIVDTPHDERLDIAFELCWVIERALFGCEEFENGSIKDCQDELGNNEQQYSSFRSDNGFTLMGLSRRLPYFLLAPESIDKNLAFFEGIDYISFFKDFSDKDVFESLVFLNTREKNKAFTPNLLMKRFSFNLEKSREIINILHKYGVINTTQIEMDDAIQEVYTFVPTPSFVALLIFAQEMINQPRSFRYYNGGRVKPYFK